MIFHVLTIFPEFFEGPFAHGVVKRAKVDDRRLSAAFHHHAKLGLPKRVKLAAGEVLAGEAGVGLRAGSGLRAGKLRP